MTIRALIKQLSDLADTLPKGRDTEAVAWVRVPNAGESAILEISNIQQGFRKEQGGTVATLCLDSRA